MTIGIDVSKDTLAVWRSSGSPRTIPNTRQGVTSLLGSIEPESTIAMEATGAYHKLLADTACSKGFKVVVFNPKDVLHYARSISPRAKTDSVDAKVIASYARVRTDHRTYQPTSPAAAKLRDLLRTRVLLVRDKTGLENRLRDCPESSRYLEAALAGIGDSIVEIDKEMESVSATFPEYTLLTGIPGIGLVTGSYLLMSLSSGAFASSDSFVAFLGLDIRIRQSGKKTGRSCLSKRGDPEARRLLYLAARTACRYAGPFQDLYLRYLSNGLSKIAAAVAVARKIARTAWALSRKNQPYCPERVLTQAH
jgi:transposase